MYDLTELLSRHPMVPFIRLSDYAIREPWFLPDRRLLDYLLIYIQEGHCRVVVEGVTYDLHSGDFCLIQPDTVHSLHGTTNTITPFAHMDIFYHPNREDSLAIGGGQLDLSEYRHLMQPKLNDIRGIRVPVKLTPSNPIEFRDKMLKMIECWKHQDPLLQLKAQCLASELILTILKDYGQLNIQSQSTMRSFNWITSYLFFHISEPLSVRDMAKRANLSPSRFNTVFKQKFGMSPYRYLLHLRIKHAKELLRSTEYTLEEIATYCGFSDIHHFSKTFKKMVGQSPGVYRQVLNRNRI